MQKKTTKQYIFRKNLSFPSFLSLLPQHYQSDTILSPTAGSVRVRPLPYAHAHLYSHTRSPPWSKEFMGFIKRLETEEKRLNLTSQSSRLSWHLRQQMNSTNEHLDEEKIREQYLHDLYVNWYISPSLIAWLRSQKTVPYAALPFASNSNYTKRREKVRKCKMVRRPVPEAQTAGARGCGCECKMVRRPVPEAVVKRICHKSEFYLKIQTT